MEYPMHFDEDTGRYVYLMEFEGKLCPYYFHDTKLAHQYAAYNVILKDLGNAQGAFRELDNNNGQAPIVRLSLLFAGIILYGKCYSVARGRKVSLNYKDVLKDIEQFTNTHEQLIDVRNQYVAHAGEGDYEQHPLTVNLNPDFNNKAILGYTINGIQQVHHEPYLKGYIDLIDKVKEYVSDKIDRIAMKLDDELSELDIEALYRSSKTPMPERCAPITGIPNRKSSV
jgi:hypothetical protein